jgi:hypothetical protein
MNKASYRLEHYNTIPKEYEEILYQEISNNAFEAKGHPPICPFSIFIKDQEENVLGGVSGTIFYGWMLTVAPFLPCGTFSLGLEKL